MSEDLTEKFIETLRNPHVAFELDRNLFGGVPLVHLTIPGATARSKRLRPLPVIVADEGETHADMLRRLADALETAVSS